MLRSVILAAARSSKIERLVGTAPVSRSLVRRYVAGETTAEAVATTRALAADGLLASLDYLGEDTVVVEQADATRDEYRRLLAALDEAGLAASAEISVKLSALGQRIDAELAYDRARDICEAAADAGTTVTVDMEDHTVTDSTLEIVQRLREEFDDTGAVLQAYLRRTEDDCKSQAVPKSRIRLCKGAYKEPETVAYQRSLDVDRSYVRCINALMAGEGYPMLATHDPRLIEIGIDRARWYDRDKDSFEFQMLYGIRPAEQLRLAGEGYRVRVYVPYGDQWYGYLMRRMAERPANLAVFARSLWTKS
ncbi:proline dehydrogenase family protein [Glycomyces sp. NRRL B-16210]|uniref:proline dehydrogenase family protein n=1 Tax=Glycomyces sp. NRRL B-16210 TaxID=1463821 RepID=UPI00042E7EFF|nr:proline dehydrogenase family protein [Glycomyces sp. NRRL B-16210]AHL24465.1 proline dehydrogenase [Glycomyces sp. NRRL B-16210]